MKLRFQGWHMFDYRNTTSQALVNIRLTNSKIIFYTQRIAERTGHSYNYVRARAGEIAHESKSKNLLEVLEDIDKGKMKL